MYNDLFERVIGDAPPSTVDIDGLITRRRRLSRQRGAGAILAVVATTTLLTVTALTVGRPDGARSSLAGPSPAPPSGGSASGSASAYPSPPAYSPSAVAVSPVPGRSYAAAPPTEPPATAEQRLATAMRDAVLAVAPGATFPTGTGPGSTNGFGQLGHQDGEVTGAAIGPFLEFSYDGNTRITVDGREAMVDIKVSLAGPVVQSCVSSDSCQTVTGPRGETGNLTVLASSDGTTHYHLWLDRSGVDHCTVTLDVLEPTIPSGPGGAGIPLTRDQMIQLAANPGLTLYP